ncbi:MAG: sulfatase-like hydrolase/transferase [Pseudorhizobium sp.]
MKTTHPYTKIHSRPPVSVLYTVLRISTAVVVTWIVLGLPSNPAALKAFPQVRFPLEILLLILAAVLLPFLVFFLFRIAATLLLASILFLKLADIGTGTAFQRAFNPYLDIKIMVDGWNLLSGSVGRLEAAAYIGAAAIVLFLVCMLFFWSLGGFREMSSRAARWTAVATAISLAASFTALSFVQSSLPLSASAGPYLANRLTMIRQSIADLGDFEQELQTDAIADVSQSELFSALKGTDVVIIFVESYGRSAIEDERYTQTTTNRLQQLQTRIAGAGLETRSGWLTSPTVGGLSWLAHGALLSGLWTDNQARYDRMIASDRSTLNSLFRTAGWRTTAIMPAITMAWPESAYFGYDSIRDAAGLGYQGKPFNWVTMPDQYTLSAFERLERSGAGASVMAEIALISSHAPWTPVPTLIDWESVGDGRVFNTQAESGDPPSVVWSDPERIRVQYLASIDYALQTLGSYIGRHGENTLFVILGDHQPASVITGENASRDVPTHVIGSPALLARIDSWGWSNGMLPAPTLPPLRMDGFRELFVRTYSGE